MFINWNLTYLKYFENEQLFTTNIEQKLSAIKTLVCIRIMFVDFKSAISFRISVESDHFC